MILYYVLFYNNNEEALMARRNGNTEMDAIVEAHERVVKEVRSTALRGPDGRFMSNEMGILCTSDDEAAARNGHIPVDQIGMTETPFFRSFQEYDLNEVRSFFRDPSIPEIEKAYFRAQHNLIG